MIPAAFSNSDAIISRKFGGHFGGVGGKGRHTPENHRKSRKSNLSTFKNQKMAPHCRIASGVWGGGGGGGRLKSQIISLEAKVVSGLTVL